MEKKLIEEIKERTPNLKIKHELIELIEKK